MTLQVAPNDGGALCVAGEPEELRRVLANLVSNAVKYSCDGGTVCLSLEGNAAEVVFVCADNGLGISEKDRPYLFTEFFRSTNLEALQRPGTGLGLAIVKRAVARHGGRIDVETELGTGTTFRVALPDQPGSRQGAGNSAGQSQRMPLGEAGLPRSPRSTVARACSGRDPAATCDS